MAPLALSPLGLLLAVACSVSNVFTDIARKRALDQRDLIPATFWIRVAVTVVFAVVLLVRVLGGNAIEIRDGGPIFGVEALHLAPLPTFFFYLTLDVGLITVVMWLYFRALQISPLSLCIPFLAFTPVFLIPTGFVMLGELPAPAKLLGVVLIVTGSLVMHRKLFAVGWTAPIKAVIREKGSRYMLMVAFIFSITNPLDKKLVVMSDVFTEALAYGTGLCLTYLVWGKLRRSDFRSAIRSNAMWVSFAGIADAVALLFQLASYSYIAVVITVSIKRAGIVLAVLSGWLFFHERGITDKLIASCVMLCGVLVFYLPFTLEQAAIFTGLALVAMAVALFWTRERVAEAAVR